MKTKYTLEDMKTLAHGHGGECLSDVYANTKIKLQWRCSEGHAWAAIPSNVLRGHWCEICGNVRQGRLKAKSIGDAQSLAKVRGGECLSEQYINNNRSLRWKCGKCSHEWSAALSSVQRGSWCPKCIGRLSPEEAFHELQALADSKGGACLSEQYLGARANHRWRCAEGHEWEAPRYSIRAGTWCKKCAGNERLTLEAMQDTARKLGGECLSTEYINSDQQFHWRCAEGHEWLAVGYHVRAGHWCPTCSSGNSERICKDIFEQMFSKPFRKAKPAWLLNSRGKRMELDGYCKELQVAFEYHGVQHYQHIDHFHREAQSLLQRKLDDELKEILCRDHGIHLFVIPFSIPVGEIPGFVAKLGQEKGLRFTIGNPQDVAVAEFVLPEKIQEMQVLAQQNGGRCLSVAYINSQTSLQWECGDGHRWHAIPSSIKRGSWCPKCVGKLDSAETLELLREIAREKGGECLANSYINSSIPVQWRCAEGHIWKTAPSFIRGGSWCHECAKKIRGPKRMGLAACQAAATVRGGKCLSDTYTNTDTKLRWECGDCGHVWEAIPYTVVRLGTWCPKCKNKRSPVSRS